MRRNFRTVSFFVAFAAMALSGCSKPDTEIEIPELKLEIPDIQIPDTTFGYGKVGLEICKKPESELPNLEGMEKEVREIEFQVWTQTKLDTNCDGEITGNSKITVSPHQGLIVEKPQDLKESVDYVTVENIRACSNERIEASLKNLKATYIEVDGKETEVPIFGNQATEAGDLRLALSDSDLKIPGMNTNILEGQNVLKIKYFGKCSEYSPASERGSRRCLKAEELAEKTIVLQVKFTTSHYEEPYMNNKCENSKSADKK